ncbi:MAG: hypothetical protein HYT03_00025 [Candidatus Harrisonbacteria bacterium]|nr:hypothetical protein [Candidatus Harrisonbacteria bacterium]
MTTETPLENPTAEEKERPVYENQEVKIFPHALTEYVVSCPQHAVFRVESSKGIRSYMAISSNPCVCSFSPDWQEVFDDFLSFARANSLTGNDLCLAAFFKNAPGKYNRDRMELNPDLLRFMKEVSQAV